MNWNAHSITTLTVFCGLLAVLFVPWQTTIRVPATISPRIQAVMFTPEDAQVSEVLVKKHDLVKAGDVMVKLSNTNLEYDIRLAKSNVDILENTLARFGDQTFLESRGVTQGELQAAVERTRGLIETFRQLTMVAPFDGEVISMLDALEPGSWLGKNTPVALVADRGSLEIYGYVPEKDLTRLDQHGSAKFYPENPKLKPIDARIIEIDRSETRILKHELLSERHGGSILTGKDPIEGLKPKKTFYRIRLAMAPEDVQDIELELRGTLHIDGDKHSIAVDVFRKAVSVLIRESGF